jgi:hypothetical protein
VIPPFTPAGLLPIGIHRATAHEVIQRFGWTAERRRLLVAIGRAAQALQIAGCLRFWIDGSFVTAKPDPRDWDGCWDPLGVSPLRLDPVLQDFSADGRERMRIKYLCDLVPSTFIEKRSSSTFLEYFQMDKLGRPKGVVEVLLPRGQQP